MSDAPAATTAAHARRSLARLLLVLGILVVGYAPFLHFFNALYYAGMHAGKSVGSLWLSWAFTLQVPLLGFAFLEGAVALGVGGSRSASIAAERAGLVRVGALFAAASVLSGLRDVLLTEVYATRFGAGVFFAWPAARELASPAALASLALGLALVSAHIGAGGEGAVVGSPAAAPAQRWSRAALVACWLAPLLTIPSMGGEVHFDVPTRFVHVCELVLVTALAIDWAERRSPTSARATLLAVVLADLAATLLGPSALPLLYGRGRDWMLYERLQFDHGRFVNGAVAALGALALASGALAGLLRSRGGRWLGLQTAMATEPAKRRDRSRAMWVLHVFLLVSIGWFVTSMSGLTLVWLHDLVFGVGGPIAWRTARPRLAAQAIPTLEMLASWVGAMAAAHLMVSTALRLDVAMGGASAPAGNRDTSDRQAWVAFFAAALVLCGAVVARVGWLALAAHAGR